MGSVNDAYTAIKTAVETAIPGTTELPNPYVIEANSVTFLRQGYAIAYGIAREAPQREYSATWSLQFFDIWITKEVITLESNPEPLRDTVTALHTEALAVIKATQSTTYDSGINYVETSAPEMLDTDKQILSLRVTIVARTQDTL